MNNQPCTFRDHRNTRIYIFVTTVIGTLLPFGLHAQTYVTTVEESGGAELVLPSDSTITVSSPSVNGAVALRAANPGSRISAENLSIFTTNGVGASGVDGGRIDLNGGAISVSGMFSPAVTVAGAGSQVSITGISTADPFRINAYDSSLGLIVSDNAQVNLNQTSVSVNGSGLVGALVSSATGKAYLNAANTVFSMASKDSSALRADTNAVVNVSDSQIITSDSVSVGIYALHGAEVNLTGNSSITTSGPGSVGVFVSAQGVAPTEVNFEAGTGKLIQISTAGFIGYGLYAQGLGSLANFDGVSITTTGVSAAAVRADGGAAVSLSQGRLSTSGSGGFGLNANGSGSSINALNMNISTSGADADGIMLQGGGQVSLAGSVLKAGGTGATGAYMAGGNNVLNLSGSELSSAQTYGVYSRDGISEINLVASSITGATGAIYADASAGVGDSVLLDASQNARVDGDIFADRSFSGRFDGSILNGNVIALSSGTVADNAVLDFANGSRMVGSVSGVSQVGLADSIWLMTDSSTITGLSSSAGGLSLSNGLVVFAAQGSTYKTLTSSALAGNGGFELNTSLNQGGSAAQSDLVLITGNTSGSYQLGINNSDGVGAKTVGDGIKVVQLDGASNSASFALKRPVVAGAYEYFLYQGGDSDADDWYLRSILAASNSGVQTAYNPSVAGYAVGPYINSQYGYDSIGSLHQRTGDRVAADGKPDANQTTWMRVGGGERKVQSGRFDYDADTSFVQFGNDLYQSTNDDGSRTHAGLMATLGQVNVGAADSLRSQHTGLSDHSGSMAVKAYGAGVYFTHYLDDASYLDVVGQFTHYSNDYSSVYGSTASQSANGVTLSVEAGKPFKHAGGWYVEPQIQLMYQHIRSANFDDSTVAVKGVSQGAGLVRVGGQVGYDSSASARIRPYLTANILKSIGDAPAVDIGSTKVRNDYSQQWTELGGGVTGKVTDNLSLYADLRYQRAFDGDMHGMGGSVGVRLDW